MNDRYAEIEWVRTISSQKDQVREVLSELEALVALGRTWA
jgi:hypothetical protein